MNRLVTWCSRPTSVFDSLRREMDCLMDRFSGDETADVAFAPQTNLAETDKTFEVTVDVPGLKAEDFAVELTDGQLWISGERNAEIEEDGKTWHRVERCYGKFRRGISLGPDVDADNIEAEYKDGVLRVVVPKAEAVQPKKIEVKS